MEKDNDKIVNKCLTCANTLKEVYSLVANA